MYFAKLMSTPTRNQLLELIMLKSVQRIDHLDLQDFSSEDFHEIKIFLSVLMNLLLYFTMEMNRVLDGGGGEAVGCESQGQLIKTQANWASCSGFCWFTLHTAYCL